MAKWLKVAGLAVVALLVAASASGDSNTYNYQGSGPYFNTKSGQVVDVNGNAKVVDADRDRDLWGVHTLINNQLTATSNGMADSNATPVATYNYRRMSLMIYPQLDSLSTSVRLAVQVRAHSSSATDSASAFPWYRWPVRGTTVGLGIDSLTQYAHGTRTLAQGTSANLPTGSVGAWDGEFIVQYSAQRLDTLGAGGTAGKYGAYPRGIYVPLLDATGAPFWAPYTSVRVRVLSGVRSRTRVRVDLVGSAQ